jgi:hypothetical protein
MIVAGQMRHVQAVLPIAAETLQFLRMRSDDHSMRAHVKFLFRLAGPVRNPHTRVHVSHAKSIDVLRPSSKAVGRPPRGQRVKLLFDEVVFFHPFADATPLSEPCRTIGPDLLLWS